MDEQKNQDNQKIPEPHVKIFGGDVSGLNQDNKEEGFKNWREQRRQQRRQWREEWRQDGHEHGCGHDHHHHHGGGAVWGLALILVGSLLLLNTMSVIPWSIWNYIWPFWPALLLLIGLRIVLGWGWAAQAIIFLAAVVIFSFIILFALSQIGSSFIGHLPPQLINFLNNFKPFNLPR